MGKKSEKLQKSEKSEETAEAEAAAASLKEGREEALALQRLTDSLNGDPGWY
jgi:hypothetical protein